MYGEEEDIILGMPCLSWVDCHSRDVKKVTLEDGCERKTATERRDLVATLTPESGTHGEWRHYGIGSMVRQ